MGQLKIRKAAVDDAEFIALLARITFTETFGYLFKDPQDLLDYYDQTFSVSKIRSSIQKENNIFWISFYDGLPVGYAKLKKYSKSQFVDSENISQLQKIYILKDFISKKIGLQLQNEMIQEAIELGKDSIWLSVLESNQRAISFYLKNEFIQVGRHTFDIGKEHFEFLAMYKQLK
jgi:diamine N-acetyltransferase